ncbi:MAG: glutamine amidotransferase [Erysipelotrichia bacterium]|nr:glutamine amidotransferase [Erysipelotrichia bacterium]
MNLKILWMYHDLMDLYGDKGNLLVLKSRAEKRGIEVQLDTCTLNEQKDCRDYDLFFLGGGADREQNLIYEDLLKRREQIAEAMQEKTAFLLICGGYQLFGQYYKDQDGKQVDGLGFFNYYTVAGDRDHRCIGNIAVNAEMDHERFLAVGFENHGGQTHGVESPFAKVLSGHGNTYDSGHEGFVNEQVLATYMHGPLLPKNPKIADLVLKRALKKRNGAAELAELDDSLENRARSIMLERLNVKEELK